jgi:Methylene-tetrahydrofolate reductase C terminal
VVNGPRGFARVVSGRSAHPRPGAAWPRPVRPRLAARLLYRVQRLVAPNPVYRRLARWLEGSAAGYRIFTATEQAAKSTIFGCQMCGQCALPATGYACPVTCPKQLRNGPCGGVGADGSCEVYPGVRCVWLVAYERAESQGRVADLRQLQRPIDHRRWGQSSWVNYWQGRDDGLWTERDVLGTAPAIWRSVPSMAAGKQ